MFTDKVASTYFNDKKSDCDSKDGQDDDYYSDRPSLESVVSECNKQKELLHEYKVLTNEYKKKMANLESSLDILSMEHEMNATKLRTANQHNAYLNDLNNQWQIRYNESQIDLNQFKDKVSSLQSHIKNEAQTREIQSMQEVLTMDNIGALNLQNGYNSNSSNDFNDTNLAIKQYTEENKQLTKRNLEYERRVDQLNAKHNDIFMKYNQLQNTHLDLQREIKASKHTNEELRAQFQECYLDMQFLDQENQELKRQLTRSSFFNNSPRLHSTDENKFFASALGPPSAWKRKSRSTSIISDVVQLDIITRDISDDPLFAHCYGTNAESEFIENNIEKDFYQEINNYLFQIEESLQTILRSRSLSKKQNGLHKNDEEKHDKNQETLDGIKNDHTQNVEWMNVGDLVSELRQKVCAWKKQQLMVIEQHTINYDTLQRDYNVFRDLSYRKVRNLCRVIYAMKYPKYKGVTEIFQTHLSDFATKTMTFTKQSVIDRLTH